MVQELNLPSQEIRQRLFLLQEHNIIISQEGKKDKRNEDRIGNMFTRSPDQGKMMYWSLDPDYKSVVFYRIISLQNLLETVEKDASQALYSCPRCKAQYEMRDVMITRLKCLQCDDITLVQNATELEEVRVMKTEGIQQINHLEAQMRECLNESSQLNPSRMLSSHIRVVVNECSEKTAPTAHPQTYIDPELLKYYKKVEKRAGKKAPDTGDVQVNVRGEPVNFREVTALMQLQMTEEEHLQYFRLAAHSFSRL